MYASTRFGGIILPKFWKVIQVLKKKANLAFFAFFCSLYAFFHVFHHQLANMWSTVTFEIPK